MLTERGSRIFYFLSRLFLNAGLATLAPTPYGVGIPTKTSGLSFMPYVYILKSEWGTYYIGSTTDILQRMRHHQGKHSRYTKSLGKVQLIFKQEYPSLSSARVVEKKFKKLKRRDYIEKIIKDGHIKINP